MREAIRKRAVDRLFEAMDRMAAVNTPPMTAQVSTWSSRQLKNCFIVACGFRRLGGSMKQRIHFNIAIGLGMALGLVCAAESFAAVTWHFNWYCSGCARIGARTTGTGGPFDSRSSCESARAAMQTNMDSRGGGVRAESCYSTGVDIDHSRSSPATSPQSGSAPRPPQSAYPQAPQADPSREQEARRREEEDREKRAAEDRRRAQEEFARNRDQALQLLRGVDSTELGLRGSGGLELRDAPNTRAKPQAAGARAPSSDPSVVDLGHLDPSKPAVVDPRAARGQKKIQVSEKTLTNDSYVKGFDAIRAANYEEAVLHFKKARTELGNDLLVRNGLALAEDLVKMQKRKAQVTAARWAFHEGVTAALQGNYDLGIEHIRKAIALDPSNRRYQDELLYVQGIKTGRAIAADKEQDLRQKALAERAFQVAEKSLAAMYRQDWTSAVAILEAALLINPADRTIKDVLAIARNARSKEAAAQHNRAAAGKGQ